ncbi:ketoacyl-ACP synthase III [Bacteroides sp.]|uniref:3-oxoacyl-ACP synthase III family protein n=1 Tax=Bacteroides sp. TaxID=29523 RepID=UPI002FCC0B85
MNIYIKAISYYLPEKVFDNIELAELFPEWSVDKIASKIGIDKRHISAECETASDMAVKAAECLFSEHNIDRNNIDFVLFCTQSPDYNLPTSACIIQHKLNLPTTIGALDFNLGCSGYIYGLSLAKGLVASGIASNVLLLTAETYTKYLHPKDKGNRTIFGDAATATLVSNDGFAMLEQFSLGTDGSGAENLIVRKGGARQSGAKNDLSFDENNNPISSDFLYMNGSEIFNFTQDAVPKLIADVLQKNELDKENINLFVLHQANKYMMNFLRKKMKIAEENFYYYMKDVGNTVSSTIPIALYHAQKEGYACGNVLLAGFGVGYSYGAVIIKMK